MGRRSLCLALPLALAVRPALADEAPPSESSRTPPVEVDAAPSPARRALAAGAAIGPGAVVHGLGHFVRGDPATGRTLLLLEGVGLGAMGGGLVTLFGVDTERLLVSQPDNGEQALEITEMLVRSGAIDLVVVDSVAALVARAELEGDMGDAHVGLQARLMSQALRKLTAIAHRTNTTLLFINKPGYTPKPLGSWRF